MLAGLQATAKESHRLLIIVATFRTDGRTAEQGTVRTLSLVSSIAPPST